MKVPDWGGWFAGGHIEHKEEDRNLKGFCLLCDMDDTARRMLTIFITRIIWLRKLISALLKR
jgi:hypothetical protein